MSQFDAGDSASDEIPSSDQTSAAAGRPEMTPGWASLVSLIHAYSIADDWSTPVVIQKLAFFLQEAGEPLNLEFKEHPYGPYAEGVNDVLRRMEGHLIQGYGDLSPDADMDWDAEITPLPGAIEEARAFLMNHPDTRQRLERVARLIEGFETPYSLELLAAIQWLAREEPVIRIHQAAAVNIVQKWSDRNHRTFRPDHIVIAWRQLRDQGWLETADNDLVLTASR